MTTSANGWLASPQPSRINVNPFYITGVPFLGGVKAGPVADVLGYVMSRVAVKVERIEAKYGCYGYIDNMRPVTGTSGTVSNHCSATAVDNMAKKHPRQNRDTYSAAQIRVIHALLGEVDHAVRWGGDYLNATDDDMHFEINRNRHDLLIVAAELRSHRRYTYTDRLIVKGDHGADVLHVSRRLYIKERSVFDDDMERAVKNYQREYGLAVDGKVGRETQSFLR